MKSGSQIKVKNDMTIVINSRKCIAFSLCPVDCSGEGKRVEIDLNEEEGYINSHHGQLYTGYWTRLGSRINE